MAQVDRPQVFMNESYREPRFRRLVRLYLREIIGLWGNDYEANFDTIFEGIKGAFGIMGFGVVRSGLIIQLIDHDSGRLCAEIRVITYYE